jgi:hypothetical protein
MVKTTMLKCRGGAREEAGGGLAFPNMSSRKLCQNDYFYFFIFFGLVTVKLEILAHVIHRWKGAFKSFSTVYYKPPNS